MTSLMATERAARLRAAMAERGLDLLACFGNAWQCDYLRYVADFSLLEGQGFAVKKRSGAVTLYLDHALEAERARAENPELEVVEAPHLAAEVERVLTQNREICVGTAPARLLPRRLVAHTRTPNVTDETPLIDQLLMHKSAVELDALRKSARAADEGYRVFMNAAQVGRKDYELVAEVEAFYRSKGVDDNFMILGVGGPEVRGMAPPNGRVLKKGDLVTTELTPCIDGYYAQICRTLVLGPATDAQQAAFAVFVEALEAGIAALRPGATAAGIARAENDVFRRHGLGQYTTSEFTRVRGHGLGLFPDSKPHILEDITTPIEPGMAVIVHPNTYSPDVGYLVIGDSTIATDTGCEVLTTTSRELFSMPA